MKMFNFSFRNGLLLDVRRLFWKRISGNKLNFVFENLFQPLIVAFVIAFAYLGRGNDVEPYRDSFLYFTSLYAFWVGMFGLCQSINREVQSGEWSYWVLGFQRNPYSHVLAILGVNLSFALLQSVFFVLAITLIVGVDALVAGDMLRHFTEIFISDNPGLASPFFQMGGALSPWLESKCTFLPLILGMFVFTIAQLLSVLSGAGFGMLFSALFMVSVVSLNVSVGFVVLLGMLSLCGLRANGNGNDSADIDNAFFPELERKAVMVVADEEDGGKKEFSKISLMINVGKVLPQRYFFNFSRLLSNRDLDKKTLGHLAKEWRDRFGLTNENAPPWLRLGISDVYRSPESVRTRSGVRYWLSREVPEEYDAKTYIRKYLAAHPEAIRHWRVDVWFKMLVRAVVLEITPIGIIFLSCLFLTMFLIKTKKGCYESLR